MEGVGASVHRLLSTGAVDADGQLVELLDTSGQRTHGYARRAARRVAE